MPRHNEGCWHWLLDCLRGDSTGEEKPAHQLNGGSDQDGTREIARVAEDLHIEREKICRLSEENSQLRDSLVAERTARETVDDEERSKALVLLQKELDDTIEDRDRLQAIVDRVEERNRAALFDHGLNIQAKFPTLPEIQKSISKAMKGVVRKWIFHRQTDHLTIPVHEFLANVFRLCQDKVVEYRLKHKAFFLGATTLESAPTEAMDEGVKTFMLQHMRRHYKALYPLTGGDLDKACDDIVDNLVGTLCGSTTKLDREEAVKLLSETEAHKVVKAYLPILVSVTLHPRVVFANDCGQADEFSKQIHENSVDGDKVRSGEKCIVVFPGLSTEPKAGEGVEPITKKYILPMKDATGADDIEIAA